MKILRHLDPESAIYVLVHAAKRARRGHRPSCSFRSVRNPAQALQAASVELKSRRLYAINLAKLSYREVILIIETIESLGVLEVTKLHVEIDLEQLFILIDLGRKETDWSTPIFGFRPGGGLWKGGLRSVEVDWISPNTGRWSARLKGKFPEELLA